MTRADRIVQQPERRKFLGASVALIAALPLRQAWGVDLPPTAIAGEKPKSRLILLGTGGGPTPKPNRSAPAQVIIVDGASYVIDCGNGVARQMVLAGCSLTSIRDVVHHAPAFRPQRRLRQSALAKLGNPHSRRVSTPMVRRRWRI